MQPFGRQKQRIGIGLILTWVVAMLFAFWWFQLRTMQPFDPASDDNRAVFFEAGQLGDRLQQLVSSLDTGSGASNTQPLTVVHFWNPDCACNRFNQVHVDALIHHYGEQGVRFVVVVQGEDTQSRTARLKAARAIFDHPAVVAIRADRQATQGPPSSPAVAVMKADGKLAYFGPYSIGAVCSTGNGDFVERTLERMLRGETVEAQLNTLAVGCFCHWKTAA